MNFDKQQKVRENPWPQRNNEADGLIKTVAIVLFVIFGVWLFFIFGPFLFEIGDLINYGYGINIIFRYHVYWLAFFLTLLAGIFLLSKQSSGYLMTTAALGFLLAMRLVSGLFHFFKTGTGFIDVWLGMIGLDFPLSIYSFANLGITAGFIFCLIQVNRSNVKQALGVDNKTVRIALLLGVGLLLYGFLTMIFADVLFPPKYF